MAAVAVVAETPPRNDKVAETENAQEGWDPEVMAILLTNGVNPNKALLNNEASRRSITPLPSASRVACCEESNVET